MLGDDAFQAEPACVGAKIIRIGAQLFRNPDGSGLLVEYILKKMSARVIFEAAQIVPVEIKKIER
jgi:hypothetical protein